MCRGYIDLHSIEARFHLNFREYFATEIERLQGMAVDGLVVLSESRVTLTPIGRFLMRNVAMVFDEYLASRNQQLPLSRMV